LFFSYQKSYALSGFTDIDLFFLSKKPFLGLFFKYWLIEMKNSYRFCWGRVIEQIGKIYLIINLIFG